MPRTSGKAQALQDIDTQVESIGYAYVLASSSEEEDDYEEDIEDLLVMQNVIVSNRYLLSRDTAGHHNVNILETYIQAYWVQSKTGRPPRPIYQQIAVALYVLGGGGGTGERTRHALNIGKGSGIGIYMANSKTS
ncbi:hypothetical protein L211DRAFT_866320 [Terfezia boudieri ATCC MYA-4762]|uniref:Uncharacterized protein n=1 Tax=Terfezia boudieri ATCC MYA-4762 TaxID=1051890 RepID=A0A3N4LVD9_9PEZI|nr:hypothetical protein L211DRAFT_866320 [Terfezia boudieri ATCC MYA-4762]